MGYSVQRFTASIDPNLLCGICNNVLEEAVLTPCGHTFCDTCLHTWLHRPATASCPVCRGNVREEDVKPVHAIRNLVGNFDVECEFASRGCKVVMTLERLLLHQSDCSCRPVTCAGCSVVVNRADLLSHQVHCDVILAAANDQLHPSGISDLSSPEDDLFDMSERITSLEHQIKSLQRQLRVSDSRNRVLEREYETLKSEIKRRRDEIHNMQYRDFDFQYEYGQEPGSIVELSLFIVRFLRNKPAFIDRDRVFGAIRNCYDKYSRCGDGYENDVYMLMATAYACDWFNEDQTVSLHCWLQSIARHRQYAYRPSQSSS